MHWCSWYWISKCFHFAEVNCSLYTQTTIKYCGNMYCHNTCFGWLSTAQPTGIYVACVHVAKLDYTYITLSIHSVVLWLSPNHDFSRSPPFSYVQSDYIPHNPVWFIFAHPLLPSTPPGVEAHVLPVVNWEKAVSQDSGYWKYWQETVSSPCTACKPIDNGMGVRYCMGILLVKM